MSREQLERARRGDHAAFDDLASQAFDRLFAIAHRILRDPGHAEDAVQECLIRAWRDLDALRDLDRFEAWLYRLLVHACTDQARRARRRPIEVAVIDIDGPSDDDNAMALERRDQLDRGFRQLTTEHRAVLVLHFYVGLRAAEIAEALGIPEGTAVSRIHYGTRALRRALDADMRPSTLGRPRTESTR